MSMQWNSITHKNNWLSNVGWVLIIHVKFHGLKGKGLHSKLNIVGIELPHEHV